MFKSCFKKRIQKDIKRLEEARERSRDVLKAKGVSDAEIDEIDSISWKHARTHYIDMPDASETIREYADFIVREAAKRGYDVA